MQTLDFYFLYLSYGFFSNNQYRFFCFWDFLFSKKRGYFLGFIKKILISFVFLFKTKLKNLMIPKLSDRMKSVDGAFKGFQFVLPVTGGGGGPVVSGKGLDDSCIVFFS